MLQPITIAFVVAVTALVFAIFNFGISLFVARKLGQRLQREVFVGYINKKYWDVRQLSSIKQPHTMPAQLSKTLAKCTKDANDVFLESLRYPDVARLKQSIAALDAILNAMLSLLKDYDVSQEFGRAN
jgi:hypothetical protein